VVWGGAHFELLVPPADILALPHEGAALAITQDMDAEGLAVAAQSPDGELSASTDCTTTTICGTAPALTAQTTHRPDSSGPS
jgi:hypothetical protein